MISRLVDLPNLDPNILVVLTECINGKINFIRKDSHVVIVSTLEGGHV